MSERLFHLRGEPKARKRGRLFAGRAAGPSDVGLDQARSAAPTAFQDGVADREAVAGGSGDVSKVGGPFAVRFATVRRSLLTLGGIRIGVGIDLGSRGLRRAVDLRPDGPSVLAIDLSRPRIADGRLRRDQGRPDVEDAHGAAAIAESVPGAAPACIGARCRPGKPKCSIHSTVRRSRNQTSRPSWRFRLPQVEHMLAPDHRPARGTGGFTPGTPNRRIDLSPWPLWPPTWRTGGRIRRSARQRYEVCIAASHR